MKRYLFLLVVISIIGVNLTGCANRNAANAWWYSGDIPADVVYERAPVQAFY